MAPGLSTAGYPPFPLWGTSFFGLSKARPSHPPSDTSTIFFCEVCDYIMRLLSLARHDGARAVPLSVVMNAVLNKESKDDWSLEADLLDHGM